jgi:hypothetical protein
MNRDEITELDFIAPIANVPSIMRRGILSHSLADRIDDHSVALPEFQRGIMLKGDQVCGLLDSVHRCHDRERNAP